jgi:hypothetical protein
MKLIPQIITEKKTLLFLSENSIKQRAEITIQFINDEGLKNTGYWEFVNCNFEPEKIPYTLEDWEFLAAINDKIKSLTK